MKILEGIIVSTKMKKTAVVEVSRKVRHPLYKKLLTRSKKFKVDIQGIEISSGDRVRIVEIRPISKDKHFKIAKVLEGAKSGKPGTTEKTAKKTEEVGDKTVKKQRKTVVTRRKK